MFSRGRIAAVSGLIGGLAVVSAGISCAAVAGDPASCTQSPQGDIICVQHITAQVPEGGSIPHQQTCMPTQPVTLPAAMGSGTTHLGPQVTCSLPPS